MANDFLQVKPLLVAALETALNQYLVLDDHLEDYLAPMAGKVIALRIQPFGAELFLCPGSRRIQILESYAGEPDASLSGSLAALGLMGLSATPMRSLFRGDVTLAGDAQLARKLQRLFEKLDIAWEAKLARYAGADLAHRLAGWVRGGRAWSRHGLTTFKLNLEEFLQEETRELPAKPEAEQVFQRIDELRQDADRLTARLDRLAAALTPPTEPR
ncbi:sterol-binding protein [Methylococcaceae bacterium WWC4]|nr:sterol-binding protein [Methylococcaceae bacterium WWC4]